MFNTKLKVIIIFAVLLTGAFSYIMNAPLNHNEHMYITSGVLVGNNSLYEDFAYLQMPYLPLIYGTFYKLTGTSYYLLWGRVFTFLSISLLCLLTYVISHKTSEDIFVSVVAVVFIMLNRVTLKAMGESSNYIMPAVFSLFSVGLFIRTLVSTSKPEIRKLHQDSISLFLCGFFVAVATGIKLYYLVTLFPFLIISRKSFKKFLLILGGAVTGFLPALYYMIKNFDIFIFNNLGYHMTNSVYSEIVGYSNAISSTSKIKYGIRILSHPASVAIFTTVLFIIFTGMDGKKKALRPVEGVLLLQFIFTLVGVFTLTPLHMQYFAMPIPFIVILISSWYGSVGADKKYLKRLLLCLTIIVFATEGTKLFRDIGKLENTNKWTGIHIHNTAMEIRKAIGRVNKNDKIATLSPLYAIEANLPIYKELSTGPFLYEVGDLLSKEKREAVNGTSPNTLHFLFQSDSPKAILVGFEKKKDLPLIMYAEKNNYMKLKRRFSGGILYIRNENR